MANMLELENILGIIKADPESHDQSSWGSETACGTTMCFAGWTCHLDPNTKVKWEELEGDHEAYMDNIVSVMENGVKFREEFIDYRAAEILDLTDTQRTALFFDARSLGDVERTIKAIGNGEL